MEPESDPFETPGTGSYLVFFICVFVAFFLVVMGVGYLVFFFVSDM